MAYSIDLRERLVEYVESGHKIVEACRIFKVSRQTARKWIRLKKETGSVARKIYRHGAIKLNDQELIDYVRDNPDLTLEEYAKKFNMSPSGIWRAFKRLKITLKKTKRYKERDEKKRAEYRKVIAQYNENEIVYVDESGVEECLHRSKAWSQRGIPVHGDVSGKKYDRENFIAAKVGNRVIAPFCFKGSCNTQVFNTWVEKCLVPSLKPGQVVVMDNASFHKSSKTRKLIESAGCKLVFLPPYSPDLNPIEKLWASLKSTLSRIVSGFSSLSDAIDSCFRKLCNE
jgi:transposase